MASLSLMKTSPLPPWPRDELSALSHPALLRAVQERVEQALARCREVHPALPAPKVWFDLKGASAGQAHLGRGGLRFNPVLLADNREEFYCLTFDISTYFYNYTFLL